MLANTKRLKNKIHGLHLPWWFNLVKWGIPYTFGGLTAMMLILMLGGWVDMPASVPLLQWVDALFMAMQPAIRFLAVILVGLGSFLSTLAITSVMVRGLLFPITERAALEGVEISAQLFEQTKELQQNILTQTALNDQFKSQSEFLKGYTTVLRRDIFNKVSPNKPEEVEIHEKCSDSQEERLEEDQDNDEELSAELESSQSEEQQDSDKAPSVNRDKPEPVMFGQQKQKNKVKSNDRPSANYNHVSHQKGRKNDPSTLRYYR